MIAVLDPAWFTARPAGPQEEVRLGQDLRTIVAFLAQTKAELIPVDDYWRPLWEELIRPLEADFPGARPALTELRKRASRATVAPLTTQHRVWGFRHMFDVPALKLAPEWADRMGTSILRLGTLGRKLVLLARPVVGRNLRRHQVGHVVLDEATRWRLHAQLSAPERLVVPCAHVARQVAQDWLTRFDPRLPSRADQARYPFCPPERWYARDTTVVTTRESKPAFVDRLGNAWTRPNIPGGSGYHWDVFLSAPGLVQAVGLDQLNIVEHGAPASEGTAGSIHHVPAEKRSAVRDCGWSCP